MKEFSKESRKQDILGFVVNYTNTLGIAPTLREIGQATGINSTSLITHYLDSLEEEGSIHRPFRRLGANRAIVVTLYPTPIDFYKKFE